MFLKPDELEVVRQMVVVKLGGGPGAMCLFNLLEEMNSHRKILAVDEPMLQRLVSEELDRRESLVIAERERILAAIQEEVLGKIEVMQEEALGTIESLAAEQEEALGAIVALAAEQKAEEPAVLVPEPVTPPLVLNPVPGFVQPAPLALNPVPGFVQPAPMM